MNTYLSHLTSTSGLESSTMNTASVFTGTNVVSGNLVRNSTAGSITNIDKLVNKKYNTYNYRNHFIMCLF